MNRVYFARNPLLSQMWREDALRARTQKTNQKKI